MFNRDKDIKSDNFYILPNNNQKKKVESIKEKKRQ